MPGRGGEKREPTSKQMPGRGGEKREPGWRWEHDTDGKKKRRRAEVGRTGIKNKGRSRLDRRIGVGAFTVAERGITKGQCKKESSSVPSCTMHN
jgi:hypothetical protein